MTMYPFILDIVKYTLSGIGIVWVAFYLLKPYLDRPSVIAASATGASSQALTLKLQAYERVLLFIDRISPANMLVRVGPSSYQAAELQSILLSEVRNEFQHNVTQQLYVSQQAWEVMNKVKNDTLGLISSAARSLPPEASGLDLAKSILGRLAEVEQDPYEMAAALVKNDVRHLF